MLISRQLQSCCDAINIPAIFMMFVIAVLVLYIQQYIQATQSANSQTNNIDKAEGFIFQQEANGDLEIIFYHSFWLMVDSSLFIVGLGLLFAVYGLVFGCPQIQQYKRAMQRCSTWLLQPGQIIFLFIFKLSHFQICKLVSLAHQHIS